MKLIWTMSKLNASSITVLKISTGRASPRATCKGLNCYLAKDLLSLSESKLNTAVIQGTLLEIENETYTV